MLLNAASTCATVYDSPSRWAPTPSRSLAARLSLIVISSTVDGSASRPATTRAPSTSVPNFVSVAAATSARFGARGMMIPNTSRAANHATPRTRANARSCVGVGGTEPPTRICTSAERLDALNRANAVSLRRAPAAADSTTAPTTPTTNASTTLSATADGSRRGPASRPRPPQQPPSRRHGTGSRRHPPRRQATDPTATPHSRPPPPSHTQDGQTPQIQSASTPNRDLQRHDRLSDERTAGSRPQRRTRPSGQATTESHISTTAKPRRL